MTTCRRGAVLVVEQRTVRQIAKVLVEPLTLALALSLGVLGGSLGWHAREAASAPPVAQAVAPPVSRSQPTAGAMAYADALCANDLAYLQEHTGESWGPLPWEPRLSDWTLPCTRYRYLGALVDRLGRDQFVFTLLRGDGTEVLFIVTFGRDGLVARID